MSSARELGIWVGVVLLVANSPLAAADLFIEAPKLRPSLVAEEQPSAFYLRGDLGFSNQTITGLRNSIDPSSQLLSAGFAAAPTAGLGAGYRLTPYLRLDVTGEYRANAAFTGLERYRDASLPLGFGTDEYRAMKSEALFLGNVYADLGTWYGLTPFVGVGLGVSANRISSFTDVNTVTQGVAFAKTGSKLGFAWALHAGASLEVTRNLQMELAYRYVSLGDGQTGTLRNYAGQCSVCMPIVFKNIASNDIRLGLRWTPTFATVR